MDYVNLAAAAWNELFSEGLVRNMQGASILGCVAVTAILTWVVRDLWDRVSWLDGCSATFADLAAVDERVGMLEMAVSQTRHKVDKHEEMLAHMQRMRDAKAAKKAKQVA